MDDEILGKLFRALYKHGVRYALFGGLAMVAHRLARATDDVDLFLAEGDDNVQAVIAALHETFEGDSGVDEITAADLNEYGLIRFGVRDYDMVVDLTQRIGEVFRYDNLEIQEVEMYDCPVTVVSPRTLVLMKRDTRRPQDVADVERLRLHFQIEDI